MEADTYSVSRALGPGRPPWGRWEVHDRAGLLVGIVAEEPATRPGRPSTFAVVHNPGPTPFVLRFPRVLRARGAWWSKGHGTVAAAVGSLAGYLGDQSPASRRHHLTGPSR